MSERPIKIIKAKDAPKRVTDKTDLDLIRHCKTILAKIYGKYGIDYQCFDVDCLGNCKEKLIQ